MPTTAKEAVRLERHTTPNRENDKSNCSIVKYVTILNWLPRYSRLDAISDLVAGFSLGLTLIPQSIAYAALAGLTAQVFQLYIMNLIYFLFIFLKKLLYDIRNDIYKHF